MAEDHSSLYLYTNVGLEPTTETSDVLHLYANIGLNVTAVLAPGTSLYLYKNVTDDQPSPQITEVDPYDLLVPGEGAVIEGWNFEGRDDGGDMQPVVRFYGAPTISAFYIQLTVVSWDLAPIPGVTRDSVTVLLPDVLPSIGYLCIVHEGPDQNPYRPYSNFFAVAVLVDPQTLNVVNFDNKDVNFPTSAAADSYWIGHGSLSRKLYITSKRTAPFSFDGEDVEILTPATFIDPPRTNEIQTLYNQATGGTFTVTIGSYGTTAAIAYNASAAVLQTAVNLLVGIHTAVTGLGTPASPWIITFTTPASTDVPTLSTDDSLLTGGTPLSIGVTTQIGGEGVIPDNSFPQGFFATRKHDRMWVANCRYADGTDHKSRLHYSDALAPEAWWAEDYVDFDPDDGQEITGLVSFGEGLVIFKDSNVQLLTGASEASFTRQMLIDNTGTVSPYTIAIVGGVLFFMDRNSGVWKFNGAEFTPISDNIRSYLLENLNYPAMYTAAGFAYRNKYVLSVPWGSSVSPNRTFVYDTTTEAWTEYDYGFRDATAARDRIYSVAPREAAGVYEMNAGNSDNGVPIDAVFETPWIAPGGHSNKHRTRRLDFAFANLGGAVTIGQYNDFDPTVAVASTTELVSHASKDQVLHLVGGFSSTRWETMQLKVTNVAGSDFQLNRVVLLWNSLSRMRGSDG